MEADLVELPVEVKMAAIEAREVYRFFHVGSEEVKALRGVDFVAAEGEFVALFGPSGSGKSTLLMCLAGVDEPDGGSVQVMGEAMTRRPEAEKAKLRAKYLGVMRQGNNLFPHLTVAENLAFVRSGDGSRDILADIGIADRGRSLPAQLSGGERARAGIAVALASSPKVLLLDEPTGEVDAESEAAILSILAAFCAKGGAVVAATHSAGLARAAHRTATLRDGRMFDD
jgi:putative ABC transport system ATP-binding protein